MSRPIKKITRAAELKEVTQEYTLDLLRDIVRALRESGIKLELTRTDEYDGENHTGHSFELKAGHGKK